MDLPKFVILRHNTYWYRRTWPTALKSLASTAKFSLNLGVKVTDPAHKLHSAVSTADAAFHLEVQRLQNSDVRAIRDDVIDKLADKALRKHRLSDAAYTPAKMPVTTGAKITMPKVAATVDPLTGKVKETDGDYVPPEPQATVDHTGRITVAEGATLSSDQIAHYATQAAIQMITNELSTETELDRQVAERIKTRLTSRSSNRPSTLSGIWAHYNRWKNVEATMSEKRLKKRDLYWSRALSYIGDHPVHHGIYREINAGLKAAAQDDLDRGLKSESVKRKLVEPVAAFKYAADEWDLDWVIKMPRLPQGDKGERKTATRDQQIALAKRCVENPDEKSAILLLCMHGMIISEVGSIQSTSGLDSDIPHVVVPVGKTKARRRVVPLSFGQDVIWEYLDGAIEYLRNSKDDNASATLNKRIRTTLGSDCGVTLYSFRHSARNSWVLSGCNDSLMFAALGWSGGRNNASLRYGGEGIAESEFIAELKRYSDIAHKHIIKGLRRKAK